MSLLMWINTTSMNVHCRSDNIPEESVMCGDTTRDCNYVSEDTVYELIRSDLGGIVNDDLITRSFDSIVDLQMGQMRTLTDTL